MKQDDEYVRRRERMVEEQLAGHGIKASSVLNAMRSVPREMFVPKEYLSEAYADAAIPIEEGQTISQPYMVAFMLQSLDLGPGDKVLEVGAGSGYAAAVLSQIVKQVDAVERHEPLVRLANDRLRHLAYNNVNIFHSKGNLGLPERAPYDAILVSAAGREEVLPKLLSQLVTGGRMVIPIGADGYENLLKYTKLGEKESREEHLATVRFVPLVSDPGKGNYK